MSARADDRPALAVPTRGLARVATLPALLGDHTLVRQPDASTRAVLAWGRKPSASEARRVAEQHGLPLWQVEDAFLRSVTLGPDSPPLGIVVDDLGIYYDAAEPSRLEALIAAPCTPERQARARELMRLWREQRVSKYNHAREQPVHGQAPFVLVIDQTFGDASIRCGMAQPADFTRMLEAALDEHPDLPIVLKLHPDVLAGRKRGHFEALTPGQAARVTLLGDDTHAPALIEPAHAVYTVTSQMGFEALLWGRPVRTFGMPFYAGWGLTEDAAPAPGRRHAVALESLIHAALVDYARYLDPETGQRCEIERLLAWMGLQRRMRSRFAPQVHALSFSRWKKPIVRAFLAGSDVRFVRRASAVPAGATVAVWGRRDAPAQAGAVVRLEDGFLRSVGLGADLVRPLSWVVDRRGMYYDAAAPSDLEHLLQNATFDAELATRARCLRERISAAGITKYNVGSGLWRRPPGARRVVLVPGQVETDAAIAYGAPGIRSNMGLLAAVRQAVPDAYVVYKPHPDVVAGLRPDGEGENDAKRHCDEIVVDVPMHVLLNAVDEVHVLTSLAGFEALLRGRRVVTYGQPFYAGWGLTDDDHAPPARRTRSLTLDELVAGVLVLYPTYVSRRSGAFTTPESALDELLQWRQQGGAAVAWWRGAMRSALRWFSPATKR